MNNKFWLEDPTILYKDYTAFFPKYDSTKINQLNDLTRFFIYLFILFLIFRRSPLLPFLGIIIIIFFWYINKNDILAKDKELYRILSKRKRAQDIYNTIDRNQLLHDDDDGIRLEDSNKLVNDNIQVGIYDSDNRLNIGGYRGVKEKGGDGGAGLYTVDEIMEYKKNTSKRPTVENPFMNPNILDYNNGDPPAASNVDDDEIKEQMTINYNHDLYQNVDELWDKKNSQRQFYTIPNTTIPNNQTEFANWLYKLPSNCKEDTSQCLRYVDLKYQR